MSAINYSNMTVAQLQQMQTELSAALKTAYAIEMREARLKIEAIAASVGIPLKELLAAPKPAKPVTHVPVKYRNPDDPKQEWTGRGRQPRWIKAFVDNGRQLSDLQARH